MKKSDLLEINNLIVGFQRSDIKSAGQDGQGDLIAVKGVSLSLARGETLALVGESGCGKTVLCKSMLRLLCEKGRIHDGQIYFEGKDLVPLSEKEMRTYRGSGIAMVLQDPAVALDPAFSVGQQIAEVLQLHKGMSRKAAERRATELLEKVQIPEASHRFHQRPYQFSGGMRQRAAIAMALAGEPQLFIADEPTTALDEDAQQEILKLLKSVQRDTGAAMLFITHDLGIVEEIAEQVAIMKDGVIVERGAVREIFAAPQHPYTQELLGHLECEKKKIPGKKAQGHEIGGFLNTFGTVREPGFLSPPAEEERSKKTLSARQLCLSIEKLTKRFPVSRRDSITVFEDLSMEMYAGEIVGLVGPSGCGKTTLARCIMGIEKQDSGEIHLGNGDMRNGSLAVCAQMIFQDSATAFNDRMTVREIIGEPLVIRRKLKRRRKKKCELQRSEGRDTAGDFTGDVRIAMQVTELDYETFAERRPYELSGGQRQRVAIARALITEPDIIIADEPLTGLDVSAQAQIAGLFRKLSDERGLAVLFIAHDLSMVEHISDRVIYLATES